MSRKVLIVAAGTGGHLYPGVATARALVRQGAEVIFAVRRGDMGKDLLKREGFSVREFSGQGFPRRLSVGLFTFPFRLAAGFFQAWYVLKELQPVAVLGMGGYLSFPILMTARLQGLPTHIHEQNVLPGLANRLLSRWVSSVAISFPEAEKHFSNKSNVWVSGLPVRPEIGSFSTADARREWGFDAERLTFLIFGGSLGAVRLNRAAVEAWQRLGEKADRFQVLHITGNKDFERTREAYQGLPVKANVLAYCHQMPAAYAAADLIVCRAGASTIAELCVVQKPVILVPYPHAAENHQLYNAEILVQHAVAHILQDSELSGLSLAHILESYLDRPERLAQIRQRYQKGLKGELHLHAADELARKLLQEDVEKTRGI